MVVYTVLNIFFSGLWLKVMYFLCPTGALEPVVVKNNRDGTHTVNYTPAQEGPYTVSVKYANQEVPGR